MNDNKHKIGARVHHSRYGHGLVSEVEGNKITVDFDSGVQKKILDSFLSVFPFGRPFRPTFDFVSRRVESVDATEWADGTNLVTVNATSVRMPASKFQFEFVASSDDARRSKRLDALLHAIGIQSAVNDIDDMVGRYFAVKNGGKDAGDFDRLEYATACYQCDVGRYRDGLLYAAQCAAEDAAMEGSAIAA